VPNPSPRTIDVHTHFYPRAYVEDLRRTPGIARIDSWGSDLAVYYAGDYNVLAPGHLDLDARLRDMDAAGMDAAVVSLTTPGVHVEEASRGIALAQAVNDAYAEMARANPGRIYAYAALPMQAPQAAVDELDRAVRQLGLQGALTFANVNGKPLDHPDFLPIWQKAAELRVPIFVHPTTPPAPEPFLDYRLVAIFGFAVDTSLAVMRLLLSGILDSLPGLMLHVAHLGGVVPYMAERMDRAYRAYAEVRERVHRPPSAILRDHCYLDTVLFEPSAIRFAAGLFGTDRLLLGSDYPHQVGDLSGAVPAVEHAELGATANEAIFSGNARGLYRLAQPAG
jgi:aminocarboxymuconate-semialdehyde decarboxylase